MGNPFDQFDTQASEGSNPFDQFDAPKKKQNKGIAADLVTDVKRGVQQLPGAVTGLIDIPVAAVTGSPLVSGLADKAGEITGFQPSKWAKSAEAEYSPSRQAGRAEVDNAWEQGTVSDIAGAYLKNPMNIVGSVAESIPSMLVGGLAGRAALGIGAKTVSAGAGGVGAALPGVIARTVGTSMAPAVGAGIGEGGIMAGQAMQNSLEAGVDPRTAAGYAGATGLIGGALGTLGGKVAQKFGVVDPETLIAGGIGRQASNATGMAAAKEVGKRVAGGAISEGLFEELPQSVFEQGFQNLAQDKPLTEGMARAGVEGALAGSFMGGAFNAIPGGRYAESKINAQAKPQDEQQPIAGLLPSPTYTGTPGSQIVENDAARQAAVDAADKNAADLYAMRDAFEAARQNVVLVADPVPVQQRIDAMLGLDTARMDKKGRALYEKDLAAAFNEQIGITLDADQREVPFTMGEYLDSQIKADDAVRARERIPAQTANQQASTRLAQLADEEAQQQVALTQDLTRSAAQGGALSKAALSGMATGATQMPVHPMRSAIEQQMLSDEAAQAELAPIQRQMQSRSTEQVRRIAENEKAIPKIRQAAIADLQRRMATQAQPTTTRPLQQTATQLNVPAPGSVPVQNIPTNPVTNVQGSNAGTVNVPNRITGGNVSGELSDSFADMHELGRDDAVKYWNANRQNMGASGGQRGASIPKGPGMDGSTTNSQWKLAFHQKIDELSKTVGSNEYAPRNSASLVSPQFDVSQRNPDQLAYLASNGKPGWKEAAAARLQSLGLPVPAAATSVTPPANPGGKSGIAKGAAGIAQRQTNAANNFIDSVQEQFGLSKEDAGKAWDHFVKNKLVKIDSVGGQYTLTDGRLWDGDVMRQAASAVDAVSQPKTNPVTDRAKNIRRLQKELEGATPMSRRESGVIGRLITAVTDDAMKSIEAGTPPAYTAGNGSFIVIHPSAQKDGMVQVTRYNENGVFGDSQYNNIEDAIRDNSVWMKRRMSDDEATTALDNSAKAEAEYQKRNAEPNAGVAHARAVAPKRTGPQSRDDLVGAILRVTGGKGIHPKMAQTIVGDKANAATKVRGLFTLRGQEDLDDIAELLRIEENYDVRDGNHLAELVRQQAGGDPVYSMERVERDTAENEVRKHRDDIRRRAAEFGIRTAFRKFDDVERDVLEAETKQAQDEERAERDEIQAEEAVSELDDDQINVLLEYAAQEDKEKGRYINDQWISNDEILDAFDGTETLEEPEDAQGAARAGEVVAGDAGRNRQGRGDEAGFDLAAQTPEELRAKAEQERAAAAQAHREEVRAIRAEQAAKNKAEKDRRAAQVIAEREAAKKAEVDKDVEVFALGQNAPPPIVRKVTNDDARGQQDIVAQQQGNELVGAFTIRADGIEGKEIPASSVQNGSDAFQYALGKTEDDGATAIFRRKASERGTYGGWRWEADAPIVSKYEIEAARQKALIRKAETDSAAKALRTKLGNGLEKEIRDDPSVSELIVVDMSHMANVEGFSVRATVGDMHVYGTSYRDLGKDVSYAIFKIGSKERVFKEVGGDLEGLHAYTALALGVEKAKSFLAQQKPAEPVAQPKPERGEVGASLTKEQRKSVLKTLADVYRQKNAPRESKGVDSNGNERSGYAYSPDLFEKSDITGAMVRYYVTLPDGRIAHPTELFADYTQSDIDAAMQKEIDADRNRDNAEKFERARLLSLAASTIVEANGKFNHANRHEPMRDYVPVLLTNGELYLRSRPENADKTAKLLGDGWRVEAQPKAEPAAQPKRESSQEWVDKDKTPDQLRADKVDSLAVELAGQITEESHQSDFAPSEMPTIVRAWADDARVPADELRQALLKSLIKFDISEGRLAQIRRALDPTNKPAAQPKAEPAKAQSDDWLNAMFGQAPSAEQAEKENADSVKSAQDKADRVDAAIAMLSGEIEANNAAAAELAARKYKANRKQIELQGDGPGRNGSMSISAINESRKRRAIEASLNASSAIKKAIEFISENPDSAFKQVLDMESAVTKQFNEGFFGKSAKLDDKLDMAVGSMIGAGSYSGNGSAGRKLRMAAHAYFAKAQEPATADVPFDSAAFDKAREDTINASKKSGAKHLDSVAPSVETMRGREIFYAHNPKQRGVIRTVDNRGNVYVYWADKYSADKELASESAEDNKSWLKSTKALPYLRIERDGKTFVMESSLGTTDLKDYVFADSVSKQEQSPAAGKQEVAAGKEPWQMTRERAVWEEYAPDGSSTDRALAARLAKWEKIKREAGNISIEAVDKAIAIEKARIERANTHRTAVEQAIADGKPVPANVLADYPDLKPKAVEPELVERSYGGINHFFLKSDVLGDKEQIRMYTPDGKPKQGFAVRAKLEDPVGGRNDKPTPVDAKSNAKEAPPKYGIYQLADGSFAKFDRVWYRGEDTERAAMLSEVVIPGNASPKDRLPSQSWVFVKGFSRNEFDGSPNRLTKNGEDVAVDAAKQPETEPAEQEAKPADGVRYSKVSDAPAGEELVAIHNLSPENVLHAASIGGIPVPSIGITKLSSPFTDFGEITLIADKGMIDPEKSVPVFDRDAYTARFPELNYKKVTAKKADAFYERMNPARELGDDGGQFISMLWDAVKNARVQTPKKVADLFRTYLAPRMLYAKEVLGKEINPPMIPIKASVFFGHEKSWRDFVKNNAELKRTDEDAYNAAAAKAIKIAANEFIDRASADDVIRSQVRSAYMEEVDRYVKDSVNWNYLDRAIKSAQDFGKKRVDIVALSNRVAKIVPQDDPAYLKWASEQIAGLFDAPTITLRGRGVDATLSNIVEAMTIGKTVGAEKTMTFGVGKTSAMLGKRFKSIKEIQDHRNQVVSSNRENEMKKDSEKLLEEYRLKAVEHFTHTDWKGNIDVFAGFDAAMEALAKAGKGALTDANIASAMRSVGFKNVPSDVIGLARQGIVSIREAATDYFEAKPQRAVKLSEFNGAVVPNGTDQEVIDALKASGITDIRTYKRGDEEGRKKSVALLAKKIHAQNKNTLFSNSAEGAANTESFPRAQAESRIKSILGDKLGKVLIDSGIVTLVDTEQGLRNLNGAKYMVAWHGSPHDHNKFDSSKIGTGEGAQAYGYGLYFAGAKDVAEWYRDKLSHGDTVFFDGIEVERVPGESNFANVSDFESDVIRALIYKDGNLAAARAYLKSDMEHTASPRSAVIPSERERATAMLNGFDKNFDEVANRVRIEKGRLYQVELAPRADEYLDWDKPLSEQSDTVKAALSEIGFPIARVESDKTGFYVVDGEGRNEFYKNESAANEAANNYNDKRGSQIYKHLVNNAITKAHIGKSGEYVSLPAGFNEGKASSDYLHSIGIRGIRYLDGSSRNKGEGNSNYVIFSDDDVSITAKYAKENGGIQGATFPDGRIALVLENLNSNNFDGIFAHEGFHSTIRDLVGEQTYTQMMKRLENMGATGNARQWFKDAEAAIPSNTKAENRTEELAAYAVEQYTNGTKQPNVIRQWVESLLSALRTAIIRRLPFGKLKSWAVNNLQPQDLANLAIAGLKAKAQGQLQAQGREAMAYSKINQTDTPEFKKWFGDSKVVDADGNPLVVYHATTYGDFNEFTKEEQRKGMAGFGFYFSDRYGSNVYAEHSQRFKMDRSWKGEPKQVNTMPVFLRMENPLLADNIADVANRFKDQGAFGVGRKVAGLSDDAKTAIQRAGYDGVITNEYVRKKRDGSLEIVSPHDKGAIKHPVYVVFEPTQVKSAIGNNGQFDGTNPDIRYSRAQIIGDSGRQYEPAQRQFFKNVGRDIEKKNLVERTTESLKNDFWKKMAVGIVDQFRGLRDLGDNGQAYMLARLSKGTAGAFDALLHHGKLSIRDGVYDADTSGGFIERLGTPLHGELDDFLWYVAANRAEGLSKVDRENLFTPTDIAAGKSLANGNTNFDYTIQTGAQKGTTTRNRATIYADANRVFNEFQKNTLDMAEQSGLIDGSSRKLWESEFYVPFYRVSEEDGEFIGSKMGNALVRQQAFKKLKGGTEKLNSDLLSNTLLNFSHLIEASAKNRAAKASLVAAEKIGAAHKATPGEKKTVWFMDNGKKIEYGVDDPFVMTAITSLEYAGMRNGIMDVMTKFKHWLTIGVTASPAFKVRNLIRDSIQSIGASELGYNPIKNIAEGYKQTKRDSQEYVSALASGGLIRFGTMLEGSESARVRQLVKAGVKDSTILNSENKWRAFYDQYLDPAVSAYNELGNRSEEINRAALYNQLVKQGKSHAEAALLARDLMDFSMQGSFNTIRFLTQVVPFMNARLQGMYKLGRSAKDNPRKLAVVTGAVALASIALMLAYGDDDDWKRREDWDRDNFWWFKFGDVEFRIPKPFEVGAIGTLAERGLELMIDDEMTGERFRNVVNSLVMNNLSMNPIPQAFKPILDLYANKDSFTKRPIESLGMQRLDPTERFNSNTSMVARGMSKASLGALSPVQIDHLARAYFGWLGSFVIGGADMVSRSVSDEPTKPALDYFRFGTQGILKEVGTGSSRYVTQVYEQAKEIEQAHATYRQMLKDGRMEEAKEYAEDNNDQLIRYRKVESVKKMESNLNERIRKIERSDMDSDQKKDAIALINKQKEQVAKRIAVGA